MSYIDNNQMKDGISIRSQEEQFSHFIASVFWRNMSIVPRKYFLPKMATQDEDRKYSFDLNVGNIKVGVRLRTFSYIKHNDVSIRSKVISGINTEIDKITNGEGQINFYGWINPKKDRIIRFVAYDLEPIRDLLYDNGYELPNGDGSYAKYYSIDWLKEHKSFLFEYKKVNGKWIKKI